MAINDLHKFLEKLLNREINSDERVPLSSAQVARVTAWMAANGLEHHVEKVQGQRTISLSMVVGTRHQASANDLRSTFGHVSPENSSKPSDKESCRVGVDIQSITEMFRDIGINNLKGSSELANIFSLRELSYAEANSDVRSTLTGLFAAKEAIVKTGFRAPYPSIEVLPMADGRPGFGDYAISISHSGDFAVAVAVSVKEGGASYRNQDPINDKNESESPASENLVSQSDRVKVSDLIVRFFVAVLVIQSFLKYLNLI